MTTANGPSMQQIDLCLHYHLETIVDAIKHHTAQCGGIRTPFVRFMAPDRHFHQTRYMHHGATLDHIACKGHLDCSKCSVTTLYILEKHHKKILAEIKDLVKKNPEEIKVKYGNPGPPPTTKFIKTPIFIANARFLILFLQKQIGERSFQTCRDALDLVFVPDMAQEVLSYIGVND